MCGPSKAMKNLNQTVQNFTKQVTSEAGTVFGAANTVFNNIMNAVQGIVSGGPSQAGYSENELNAKNAANVEAGGAMARNLRGATASAAGAIGGGNTVAPSGTTQTAIQSADIAAAKQTAEGENQILQGDYETGRQNFFKALGEEAAAPGVYGVANQFNETAGSQQQTAMKSQQAMDTQSNWWKSDIMKLATYNPSSMIQGMPGMSGQTSTMPSPPSQGQNQGFSPGGGGMQWSPDSFGGSGDAGGGGGGE